MRTRVIKEVGFEEALFGLALSYNSDPSVRVAKKLAFKQGGHNKFLESMVVWIDMTAPRYFWQQFDTYRVGTTKQSESTMHTILRTSFTEDMFEGNDTSLAMINMLNHMRAEEDWEKLKQHLPESFLQRRIVCTNYKVLQNMVAQRWSHKLPEWRSFLDDILWQVKYQDFLKE